MTEPRHIGPNDPPYPPTIYSPTDGSVGNTTALAVVATGAGDPNYDAHLASSLEYGLPPAYGIESWGAQTGPTTQGVWTATFHPVLTRGSWHNFRAAFQDSHGAWSAWGPTVWHYVKRLPNPVEVTAGMQPIHNLTELATWSGAEAKPILQYYLTDPDGDLLRFIGVEVRDAPGGTLLYSAGYYGYWGNGAVVDLPLDHGFPNDVTRYVRAYTIDIDGNESAWGAYAACKVRWTQAIYQYQGGVAAGQYLFDYGAVGGSSPTVAAIFRPATGASGAGAGAWVATVDEVGSTEWLNILVRLAIGRDTSAATTLADMTLSFLAAAQQPDTWKFYELDATNWKLDENQRRYGTKSLRWVRQTASAVGQRAFAQTEYATDPYIVPVQPDTEYTLSVWVKGTMHHGVLRGFVRLRSGVWLAETPPVTDTLGEWYRARITFTTDSSTTKVAVGVQYDATQVGTGDAIWVDAMQLEEGPVASAWTPGATGAVVMDVGGISVDATKGASFRLRGTGSSINDVIELHEHGLRFGNEWEIYSDGVVLYAENDAGQKYNLVGGSVIGAEWEFNLSVASGEAGLGGMTILRDPSGICTAASGAITVPRTGWYQLSWNVRWQAGAGLWRGLRVYVNSVIYAEAMEPVYSGGSEITNVLSTGMYLTAGQVITFTTYQDSGGALTIDTIDATFISAGTEGPPGPTGPAGSGGGVTDHGALTGLADDDHPQYATDAALTTHAATPHGGTGTSDHGALTNVTANQHHTQAHAIDGADHTGTLTDGQIPASIARDSEVTSAVSTHAATSHGVTAHTGLSGVTADQHHAQAHAISGADHTGTLLDAQIPATIARDSEVTAAVTAHEGLANPHTGYATDADLTAHAATAHGGGGVTDADFLVGTSHAGLSAEIVVGATPGGELGGTWATPTVDTSHSGSTHAATQAAAESTAAGALSTHAGAADPHTGYRLESADHTHASTGLQAGQVAHSALTGLTTGDDHTQYQKESEKGVASGYAELDSGILVPVARLGSGTPDGTKFLRDDRTWVTPTAAATSVSFPATQVPSAGANVLDDYEESLADSWDPGITFGGAATGLTYAASGRLGTYVKIGRLVVANFWVKLSNKGSSAGAMRITGLPFTAHTVTTVHPGLLLIAYYEGFAAGIYNLTALVESAAATMLLYKDSGTGVASTAVLNTDITNTFGLSGTVMYLASA